MRLPSFRLPRTHASAIYCSATPLFDLGFARQPLADGVYRCIADGTEIGFERREAFYHLTGDATPNTATLLPIASLPAHYVFQQSEGRGSTFYGGLDLAPDGFGLFSPECLRDEAIRNAKTNGATLVEAGCVFSTPDDLLAALLPLIANAPSHCWNVYRRD